MKILIAEDDYNTRTGLKDLLEGEGYQVYCAKDGKDAEILFSESNPDLVCLDVMMPGKSGYDACRSIRQQDSNVPILFLSAKSEEIDKVLGLELGADDYVVKPFGIHEILARIKALLRRSSSAAGSEKQDEIIQPFIMDDLRIDPQQLRAYRGSEEINLSRREIIILHLLAKNPGKVISKTQMFDEAWSMEYLPSSRTLDQSISQLRKKIELSPGDPKIIQTVHNAGYRWEKR